MINDGSSDDTWEHMQRAAALLPAGAVRCVDLGSNQGKRAAMAAGISETQAEMLVFVDSDSMPAPSAVRKLVQGFADPKVAAISGLTHVRNADRNVLTRMQAARYYVSFQLLKISRVGRRTLSRAAPAASPPTAGRRCCRCSSGGSTSDSSASSAPTATIAR